jgi:hypothetical protein
VPAVSAVVLYVAWPPLTATPLARTVLPSRKVTVPAVSVVLQAAQARDWQAAADLLPLVYAELHQLARARLARQAPGQTLTPTALVHEAYVRVAGDSHVTWEGRRPAAPPARPSGKEGPADEFTPYSYRLPALLIFTHYPLPSTCPPRPRKQPSHPGDVR